MNTPIPPAVYPRAVLALTMGLSTWLNTTHAAVTYTAPSWRWAIIAMSAIPPLAVPLLIELVGREARRSGVGKAFWVAATAAVLLTVLAFAVSVWAITSLGMSWGMPLPVAAAFPLVLDLGAAVATTFLLDRAAAEARAAELDEVHQPPEQDPARERPVQGHAPAYPAGLTWLAPVHHLSGHESEETATEPVHRGDAPTVTSDDASVPQPAAPVHQESETDPVHQPKRRRLAAVQAHAPVPESSVRQRTTPRAEQAVEVLPVHLQQAEAVVQAGASELPLSRIAEVYARLDAGESMTFIAKAGIANKRTIAKLRDARAEPNAAAAEETEPALA